MIYDIRKLRGNGEVSELKRLVTIYREYDKLDVILDLVIQNLGISREDFKDRIVNGKKEESYIKVNAPPQEILFCDGVQCEMPAYFEIKELDQIEIENPI
jgi:hypothetical protein